MATEHDGRSDPRFTALYMGVVEDNADPEKLGRVRVRIPGIIEPMSAWAFPLGWPAAGAKQRGTFAPPPKGAEVGVLFHQGDVDHPYYLCGNPGAGETPPELADTDPKDAHLIYAHETERYRFICDSRPGKEKWSVLDKKTADIIEMDGVKAGIQIIGSSVVYIKSDGTITLDAANINLGDRVVIPNGKPID